ncbi:Calcium/calmodulin-dependent protein kinase type 1D [Monoraphidium neglectum]|uniref:Calcium/calmodulin-dependent protein kinase type 1D n=1 Tax=Monoraphidium neglectum TaxID=145388 RepID=A0A0D2KJQ1_9CHLO|nr:Calcium/calmodulin-dependent protein kinase type 1D [Monoraphidium neglectum]KIY96073.1 Calcium/calmodulin-dependent protein kinase type 1D [Monoraphidium neglectum]|eukprot:XP_013895093.1 Calcium/calmodulin-dependent protein kinase type 1D [Monoraphidium neglectum]
MADSAMADGAEASHDISHHRSSVAILPFPARGGDAPGQLELTNPLLGQSKATDVTERFALKGVLGRGAFATTRLCVDKGSGKEFACKSIHKKRLEGLTKDWTDVRREMQVMYHLAGHPSMPQIQYACEDQNYVHIVSHVSHWPLYGDTETVMELCSGGELVDRIIDKGKYTERDAAAIMRTVLDLVAYAHELGCVHRDIK